MKTLRNGRPWPGDILPAQFFPPRATTPEQRLMLAVLEDGLEIALKPPPVGRRGRALWASTNEWVFSDDEGWPFSFLNVCHALGMEPMRVRERILDRRSAALAVPAAA